jgi:hypothetical protein
MFLTILENVQNTLRSFRNRTIVRCSSPLIIIYHLYALSTRGSIMQQHSSNIYTAVFGCGALEAALLSSTSLQCSTKRRLWMANREIIAQPQEEEHTAVGPLLREMSQRRRQNRRALLQRVEMEQGELKQSFLPTGSEPAHE